MGVGPELCIMLDTNFAELRQCEVRAVQVRRTYPRCVLRGLTVEQEPSETPDERNLGWLTLSILSD
jgi:hypothetical protein